MTDLEAIHEKIVKSANRQDFKCEVIFRCDPVPIAALTRENKNSNTPKVYLSAGIHGDEPAGVYALKELLEENYFKKDINWYIFPVLNPKGLALGTRENDDGKDLNRDYFHCTIPEVKAHIEWLKKHKNLKFDLAINLHEDWEAKGFYIYPIEKKGERSLVSSIMQKVLKVFPIDNSLVIDGRPANHGIVLLEENFAKVMKGWKDWPEAFYILSYHDPKYKYTFETASSFKIEERVAAQKAGIKAAVTEMLKQHPTKA